MTGNEQDASQSPDLLEELSNGRDDFDVDLMACGCRFNAPTAVVDISVADMLRLYNFDEAQLADFVRALIDRSGLEQEAVFELAEAAARGELQHDIPAT